MQNYSNDEQFNHPDLDTITPEEFYATYKNFMFKVGRQNGYDQFIVGTAIDDLILKICCERKHDYNPEKPFASYLAKAVKNTCCNLWRPEDRYKILKDQLTLWYDEYSDDLLRARREVYRSELLRKALDRLSRKVSDKQKMEAFTQLVIDEERPADVARHTRLNISEIYQIKAQLLPRFRTILRCLDTAC